jgi:Flp pilus assembly secretin CpaC
MHTLTAHRCGSRDAALRATLCLFLLWGGTLVAQTPESGITRVDLSIGRSFPITTTATITRASVANPDVADVVVIGERDVVINGRAPGETDVILWVTDMPRRHYRVSVHSPADRQQVIIAVKFAEVRRDLLRQVGVSGLYRDANTRAGTGIFRSDNVFDASGKIVLPSTVGFATVLSDFGTQKFLGFLDMEEQKGAARILAEPNVMAANKEDASFLAGGEIPIPVAQASSTGVPLVTVIWKEFGIRLNFTAEVVSDSLIKLKVRPEVSSLDYANAITLSGFRIPALRTRRVESTIDMRRDQSLIISGLLDDERERVKTGVPLLQDIPILGQLFSSTRWQRNETELIVVVTPVLTDPMRPRPQDVLHFAPDTTLRARQALEPRLQPIVTPRPHQPPKRE